MSAPPPAYDYSDSKAMPPSYAPQPGYTQPMPPVHSTQPYPQQPYPPAPTGGQQTTVVVAPMPTVICTFGEAPMQTVCHNCHQHIVTRVSHEVGAMAWLIFGILCFLGCWICAFIPFCVDSCHDVVHSCPSCGVVLGRFNRL